MNNADDHMRLTKAVVKNSFPNITGAVTATQDQLNGAGSIFTNGTSVLADAGAFFKTNATDGFVNTLAGDIDVKLQGVTAFTFQRTGGANFMKASGGIEATGEIKGPGITPIGSSVMWFDDTLPTDGLWVWANGQVISNAATVCPILLSRWGNRFGGNGVTTMGVPDMREVAPVGKSTMGGTTARGLLSTITTSLLTTVAAVFGVQSVTLALTQIPTHQHGVFLGDPGHTHGTNANTGASTYSGGSAGPVAIPGAATINPAFTGCFVHDGNGNLNLTAVNGGGSPHTNVQPSATVNWIIRIG
jgi:microcystin-dependent protein